MLEYALIDMNGTLQNPGRTVAIKTREQEQRVSRFSILLQHVCRGIIVQDTVFCMTLGSKYFSVSKGHP